MPTVEPSELNISLATLSLFVCGFGLISYIVKHRLYISEALVAFLFGVIIGPHVTGWVVPQGWVSEHYSASGASNPLTLAIMRIAIALSVLFAGIALPHKFVKVHARSLALLLSGAMVGGWLMCGLLIWWLIPGLTYMEALAIGACLTPTDPVLVNSITKGRFAEEDVDPDVRNLIVAESGANDGLGYPFLYLPLYWFLAHSAEPFPVGRDVGGVVARWVYDVWIYNIILAVALGAAIGYVSRHTLRFAEGKNWLDEDNFLAYGVGLTFFNLGFLGMMGTDDLLACFAAGLAFSWDDRQRRLHEDESVHDILDTLVNAAVFIYIGAVMPFGLFGSALAQVGPGRLVALAACVLAFRRLPWVIAMHWSIPALRSWRHGVFAGWFGPIGVSAVFYVTLLLEELPPGDEERTRLREVAEPVVYFLVLTSVIVHGVSIPASKGLTRSWNRVESKYFPGLYDQHIKDKEERDAELRAAEEGAAADDRERAREEEEGASRDSAGAEEEMEQDIGADVEHEERR